MISILKSLIKAVLFYNLPGRKIISVYRCEPINNKPFFDGSHNGHFERDAVAFDLPPKKVN